MLIAQPVESFSPEAPFIPTIVMSVLRMPDSVIVGNIAPVRQLTNQNLRPFILITNGSLIGRMWPTVLVPHAVKRTAGCMLPRKPPPQNAINQHKQARIAGRRVFHEAVAIREDEDR